MAITVLNSHYFTAALILSVSLTSALNAQTGHFSDFASNLGFHLRENGDGGATKGAAPAAAATIGTSGTAMDSNNTSDQPANHNPVRAVVGVGFHLTKPYPDYLSSNNTLSANRLGKVTPQYLAGVAYELPFNYADKDHQGADSDLCQDHVDYSQSVRCRPLSVFVSAKFSAAASDTVNGVTFGLAHKITPLFAVLVAGSLDPYEQVSPGFRRAAIAIVNAQSAKNSYYGLFDSKRMADLDDQDAFDGFSTNFITTSTDANTGAVSYTQGSPIFQGNPLSTRYHFGLIVGVALTPDFKNLLGIK
jgi:hypothetical protein